MTEDAGRTPADKAPSGDGPAERVPPGDIPADPPIARLPDPRHPHRLVQAPVAPLDVDGLGVATVGTILFAVAGIGAAVGYDWLQSIGRGWWLGVCISGFVLGLIGLAYCLRLRRRRLDA